MFDLDVSMENNLVLKMQMDLNRELLLKEIVSMELPEKMMLHLVIIYLLYEYLLLIVVAVAVVVDMIYHYLMNVFVHNEQKNLYHMNVDLKKRKY